MQVRNIYWWEAANHMVLSGMRTDDGIPGDKIFTVYARSQCGVDLFARGHQLLWFKRWDRGSLRGYSRCRWLTVMLWNAVPQRTLPIHLFRHFCCRMYHIATMHSVTEWQTDRVRETDDSIMPIADPGFSARRDMKVKKDNLRVTHKNIMKFMQ